MSRSVAAQADGQNDRQLGGQARLNSCSLPMFDAQRPCAAAGGVEDHRLDHRAVGRVTDMRRVALAGGVFVDDLHSSASEISRSAMRRAA